MFKKLNLKDLKIHSLAEIMPVMTEIQFKAFIEDIEINGQLENVKVVDNKIIDGRHRYKALTLLNEETINADILDENLSNEEIRVLIQSSEKRRHQTKTQLTILAWKEYIYLKKNGEKSNQDEVAKRYGVGRTNIAEVIKLNKLAPEVVERLYNGLSFNIGSDNNPILTTNLRTIAKFLKEFNYKKMIVPKEIKWTENENNDINEEIEKLQDLYPNKMVLEIAKRIYAILSEKKDENYERL
jgi:hypothetical protein